MGILLRLLFMRRSLRAAAVVRRRLQARNPSLLFAGWLFTFIYS